MEREEKTKLVLVVEATTGGIRKHILDLIQNLSRQKYKIFLVYSDLRADILFLDSVQDLIESDISLIRVEMTRNINPVSDIKSLFMLRKIFKSIQPDLIHLHAAKAGTLGRLAAISLGLRNIIYTPHGGSFHKLNEKAGFLYKCIEKILSSKNVHFIAVSRYAQNQYKTLLNISDSRNHLVYNGLSVTVSRQGLDEEETKTRFKINKDDLLILVPAVFYEAKGHLQLLDSIHNSGTKLKGNVKILFAGDGPLKTRIENKIIEYSLQETVLLIGFIPAISEVVNISDIVLLPSMNEAFGYAILEAMSFGKPVFATSVDAIPELVQDGVTGELFNKDRLFEICSRLNYFVDDRTDLIKMGAAGKSILQKSFTLEKMIAGTEKVYEQVLSAGLTA